MIWSGMHLLDELEPDDASGWDTAELRPGDRRSAGGGRRARL